MFMACAAAVFAIPEFGLSAGGGGVPGGHFTRYSLRDRSKSPQKLFNISIF